MIDVNRLRVFRAVFDSGSVHAAAAHLSYSPSTISQHLSALQRETGLTLFEKAGRGIVPTAAARRLADESGDIMGHLARLSGVVADLREGRCDRLSIATFHSAAQALLPTVGTALRSEFTDLVLYVGLNEDHSAHSVPRPDIDLRTEAVSHPDAVSTEYACPPGYSRHALHEEGYVVLVHESDPLAAQATIPMAALAGEPWVENDVATSRCAQLVRRACGSAGFTARYVAHFEEQHSAIAFVAAGFGVTIVPELVLRTTLPPTVRAVALTNPQPRRRIVAHVRQAAEPNPAIQRCLELLRQVSAAAAAEPNGYPARG